MNVILSRHSAWWDRRGVEPATLTSFPGNALTLSYCPMGLPRDCFDAYNIYDKIKQEPLSGAMYSYLHSK
jgi:hypothetical protein